VAVSEAVRESGVAVAILGKGSNVLVADPGFDGLVLRLGRSYRWSARDGNRLTAGGSMPLPALAGVALSHGLTGLEFGVAIPASMGGAVTMNAGAHGGELGDVLESVDAFGLSEGDRSARSRLRGRPVLPAVGVRAEHGRGGRDGEAVRGRARRDPLPHGRGPGVAASHAAPCRAELRERLHEPAGRSRREAD
jgi:hypothetical protein